MISNLCLPIAVLLIVFLTTGWKFVLIEKPGNASLNEAVIALENNNNEQAISLFKKAINESSGEVKAQAIYKLSKIYKSQNKTSEYIKLLKQAAALNNKNAVLALASQYLKEKNIQSAKKLFTSLVGRSAKANIGLARIAYDDEARQKHLEKAVNIYKKSASKGNINSMVGLARIYSKYEEFTPDYKQAEYWYTKAIEGGSIESVIELAEIWRITKNHDNLEADILALMKPIVKLGNKDALYLLAKAYSDGTLGNINNRKSIKWHKKAAENNHSEAMISLARIYSIGLGVNIDEKAAFSWYEKAAKLGNSEAKYQLGLAYARGYGTDKDIAESEQWLQEAQQSGYILATEIVGK